MNDKELLMMAAKAAGVVGEYRSAYVEAYNRDVYGIAPRGVGSSAFWNPITSDGDALRLAVKLNLRIEHEKHAVYVGYSGDDGEDICAESVCASISRERATRRAIVRAAAEIGSKL